MDIKILNESASVRSHSYLRPSEERKIVCAQRHFRSTMVTIQVVARKLLGTRQKRDHHLLLEELELA
jgi:hypothetical protein